MKLAPAQIKENFIQVLERTSNARKPYGLLPNENVTLLAVSKGRGAESILPLLEMGHRDFAENRVREAQDKWPELKAAYPDIRLHLIGPLQTNKVKSALALFDSIHTLDRPSLAGAIEKTSLTLPLFIQINTGSEFQKSGVLPEKADAFITGCLRRKLPIVGLMGIPPVEENPAPHFAMLSQMARRYNLPYLSMGMSNDYELAVAMGATHVRVGTAIFGERDQ